MQCPKCGSENRAGARFCGRCGQVLAAVAPAASAQPPSQPVTQVRPTGTSECTACGMSLKPGARFCPRCGVVVDDGPPARNIPMPTWAPPPVIEATSLPQERRQATPAYQPDLEWRPSVASSPEIAPTPVRQQSRGRFSWLLALGTALVSGLCFFCAIMGLVLGSAFGDTVAASPETDPSQPDLTLYVSEKYVSAMIDETLPGGIRGDTELDVRPDNLLVLTTHLDLFLVKPEIVISSRLSVVDGRIQIQVEDVDAGGHNIFNLIGVDGWMLGDDLVDMIQRGLERELGAGSRLLDIRTDDNWIILKARLN
jgi:hypothetical protein